MRLPTALGLVSGLALLAAGVSAVADDRDHDRDDVRRVQTATPIKHLVVIFQENVSFDHYFGTYPKAQNLTGETPFVAKKDTPKVNNLVTPLDVNNHFAPLGGIDLINHNPNNSQTAPNNGKQNGTAASNPFRLAPSQALTADQGHNESPEESAYDNGKMDGFPAWVGTAGPPPAGIGSKALVMGYFDGNTTTALWNYAQHFALNDNNYTTQFGPSTPGAINLISGQTNGLAATLNVVDGANNLLHGTHEAFGDAAHLVSNITEIGDGDPLLDACSSPTLDQITLAGRNIGDLLNAKNITWGSFMGGFDLSVVNANGTTGCARETNPTAPGTPAFTSVDYIPHHAWFQYWNSTLNANHVPPSSDAMIGRSDAANHEYDLSAFFTALKKHNLPAVSFLKALSIQDGHAGYSDPLDEQIFLANTINAIMQCDEWKETAVIITWDDSDGWYDHQMGPIVRQSNTTDDLLLGPGNCGSQKSNDVSGGTQNGRCGFGPRIPLLVISPFAKRNYVDHRVLDFSSITRFIEDNFNLGRIGNGSADALAGTLNGLFDFSDRASGHRLILDPKTGQIMDSDPD